MAALVLVFVFAAFVNAATMVTPVRELQDGVSRVVGIPGSWNGVGNRLCAFRSGPSISLAWICGKLSAFASGNDSRGITNGFSIALAPLGFAMWISHVASHIFPGILSLAGRRPHFSATWIRPRAPDWNIPTFAFEDSRVCKFFCWMRAFSFAFGSCGGNL